MFKNENKNNPVEAIMLLVGCYQLVCLLIMSTPFFCCIDAWLEGFLLKLSLVHIFSIAVVAFMKTAVLEFGYW